MRASIYRKPWIGLVGLLAGFMTQPLGHTVYTLIEKGTGEAAPIAAGIVGVAGFGLVWAGLRRDELQATWMGLLGGWFIWIGWFEFSFKFFSVLYDVPGFAVEPGVPGGYVAAPQANLLQATLPIMLAILLLYGIFNLQTKCNFMRFFHRNLRFSPGDPTPDNRRSFARITAFEVLFVTWFCYLFWLYMIYFGTQGRGITIIMSVYGAWTAWALYLVWRCTKQVRAAPALRYGVGAGIVLWGTAEMPAHFGAYREYWLHPFDYPVFNAISVLVFVTALVTIARRPLPGRAGGSDRDAAVANS
jgi:hypothetical protein